MRPRWSQARSVRLWAALIRKAGRRQEEVGAAIQFRHSQVSTPLERLVFLSSSSIKVILNAQSVNPSKWARSRDVGSWKLRWCLLPIVGNWRAIWNRSDT